MKSFQSFCLESTIGSGNLYHATGATQLVSMLQDDAIRFTYSSAVQAEPMKYPKHPFFLSTSRTMFGKYVHHGDYKTDSFSSDVIINLSIDKLRKYGVKLFDFDYWGPSFNKLSQFREEEEVRIFYNKPKLSPMNRFVDSIHVYVGGDGYGYRPFAVRESYELSKRLNVPIYYYENLQGFKSQRTTYAIKNVGSYINGLSFDPETEGFYNTRRRVHRRDEANLLITNLLKIYNGEYDQTDKEQYRLFRTLTAFDGPQIISSNFHNAFREHPENFTEWHRAMIKSGSKNTQEFVKKIINKASSYR